MLCYYDTEEKPYWKFFLLTWLSCDLSGCEQGQLQVQVNVALQHLPSQLQGGGAAAFLCNCVRFQIVPVSAAGKNQKTIGAKELFGEAKGGRKTFLRILLEIQFNF